MQLRFYLSKEDEKNDLPYKFEKACEHFKTQPNKSVAQHMKDVVEAHEKETPKNPHNENSN